MPQTPNAVPKVAAVARSEVCDALRILAEAATAHQDDLQQHPLINSGESDDEADSSSPVFDSFYGDGGPDAILQMKNFTEPERVQFRVGPSM